MINFLKHCFATAALLLFCFGSASIAKADSVVLMENFEGIAKGMYSTPLDVGQFFVQSGSVKVLDTGFFGDLCSAAGGSPICIGLGGSTFSSTAFFGKGTYDLSFDLAGSHVETGSNLTTLFFGDLTQPIPLSDAAPFAHFSFPGVTVGGISPFSRVVFDSTTSLDSIGNLLDNVLLVRRDVVPEPASLVLVGFGLAGLGAAAWRRGSRR